MSDSTATTLSARPYDAVLLGLLALSLTFNILIAYRFAVPNSVSSPTNANRRAGPAVGITLPPLDAELLGGGRELLRFGSDSRPTLLYVFTPACQWCSRNANNIRAVTARAQGSYRLAALSLDPDKDSVTAYVREQGIEFPVYVKPSAESVSAYALGATPHTLLIDRSGKVLQSWVGAFAGTVGSQVEAVFKLKLPGLVR